MGIITQLEHRIRSHPNRKRFIAGVRTQWVNSRWCRKGINWRVRYEDPENHLKQYSQDEIFRKWAGEPPRFNEWLIWSEYHATRLGLKEVKKATISLHRGADFFV